MPCLYVSVALVTTSVVLKLPCNYLLCCVCWRHVERFNKEPVKDGQYGLSQREIVKLKCETGRRARRSQWKQKSCKEQGDYSCVFCHKDTILIHHCKYRSVGKISRNVELLNKEDQGPLHVSSSTWGTWRGLHPFKLAQEPSWLDAISSFNSDRRSPLTDLVSEPAVLVTGPALLQLWRTHRFFPSYLHRRRLCFYFGLFVCPSDNWKSCERILTKFLGGVGHSPGTKWLNFGDDPDHRPDPGFRSPKSGFTGLLKKYLVDSDQSCIANLHCKNHSAISNSILAFGGGLCSLSTFSGGCNYH